ncbi:OsmC family protein [Desulfonatronovibrio hydrogenovorans]|uniref:OsmC family protein n=1 Tax=Desulfonatronovibrio hydrogenovorans TaxID=53245 RepID=UPI0004921C02|nr:OsmC family protein [Desulfonatronovibrio hydrogenovorans]
MNGQIKVVFHQGAKISAEVDRWKIVTDQPEKDGGQDSAPNPFQFFLASLATCAGYYALSFCRKREISTKGLSLNLVYTWTKKEGRITKMDFEITLPEGFPEKYRKALIRAVDACTVKKHLTRPPEMKVLVQE